MLESQPISGRKTILTPMRERGDQLPIYRRLVGGMPEAWEGSWWLSADC
jgi:hypothetical protein